jgi:hypothetical protein
VKKKVLLLIALGIFLAAGANSETVGKLFLRQYPVVNVAINGEEVKDGDVPSFLIENRTVIPLRPAAEKIGAFVSYNDEKDKVEVLVPNVNLLLVSDVKESYRNGYSFDYPFSKTVSNVPFKFFVFADIDNAPKTSELKLCLRIIDHNGKEVYRGDEISRDTRRSSSFYYFHQVPQGNYFPFPGEYKVQLLMKDPVSQKFLPVGENRIIAE